MESGIVLVVGDNETTEREIIGVIELLKCHGWIEKKTVIIQTKNAENAKEEIRAIGQAIESVVIIRKSPKEREFWATYELIFWVMENYPEIKMIPIRVIGEKNALQKQKNAGNKSAPLPQVWQNN